MGILKLLFESKLSSTDNGAINDFEPSIDELPLALPKPNPNGKRSNKKRIPMTDKAQNSLIQTLWTYNNADAT